MSAKNEGFKQILYQKSFSEVQLVTCDTKATAEEYEKEKRNVIKHHFE